MAISSTLLECERYCLPDPTYLLSSGLDLTGFSESKSKSMQLRRYRALFGVYPSVSYRLWSHLIRHLPSDCKINHFFWALNFLKTYNSESVRAALFNLDEKTLRKWQWIVVKSLARLKLVSTNFPSFH